MNLWRIIYTYFFFPLFAFIVKVASFFNKKIKKGLEDRQKLYENLIIDLTGLNRRRKTIWFHSASLGEFEQAKPIIEKLKGNYEVNIIVTFFSPSGYDNSKSYPFADVIAYIPLDYPTKVKRFLDLIRPDLTVFMRYDIWPNMIWELGHRKIPVFIMDATMRSNSKRKLPLVKNMHVSLYKDITKIICVSEEDKKNFLRFKIPEHKIEVVGDTRFDRVFQKSLEAKSKKLFKDDFFEGKKVFVFGSSWEFDENVVFPAVEKMLKYDSSFVMIVAPHEPTVYNIERIENYFAKTFATIRFSFLNNYDSERIIIIDSIGILLTLYYYADVAYVGGGFKAGVHNVLEPAVYGVPVLFGPKIENSQEALKLVDLGAGFVVRDKKQAYRILRTLFRDDEQRRKSGLISFDYVEKNLGATDKIITEIKSVLNFD
jgi:3-deoxy-D-manno-octulosonic-acid transferase